MHHGILVEAKKCGPVSERSRNIDDACKLIRPGCCLIRVEKGVPSPLGEYRRLGLVQALGWEWRFQSLQLSLVSGSITQLVLQQAM